MSRIAILSFYTGIVDRGVETFAFEMSKRLKNNHQVVIIQAGTITQQAGVRAHQINIDTDQPKSSKGIFGKLYLDNQSRKIFLFTLKAIPQIIKGKFDLIIPLNGGWQVSVVRILTKIIGAKILVSGHAGIGADDAWNLFWRPDAFVALTSAQESWAQALSPETKVEMIPNGVDLAKFNPKIKPKEIKLKKPIVVCASALVPYKRIDLTIKAIARSKDLSLLILGDGEMQGYLDSIGKRLLKNRYLRLNPQYSEMPSYYRAGKVFTLASVTEAFGISYLEAMACNLSVVTTSDSSRQEIIGNAGILTDPTNIKSYSKDLEIAAKTNYRSIPYDQALKFSWNKIAIKYSKLINELAKNK
ncbi:hypothetical protein A3J17_02805 [Candidatus Curtissbacteria bacterium RIFCSPLOWO2_02_FULL_40_11]|nr:MAG: hypothetical protein A3J17_02805 [Candidatus Curtissbacteria bacterium RIFCSPLOWO2_02_FULL_40_11]